MGKRKKNFKKFKAEEGPSKKLKTESSDFTLSKFEYKNEFFEEYYKSMLQPYFNGNDLEFKQFLEVLTQKLPVCFRINNTIPNYQHFLNKIKDPQWILGASSINEEKKAEASMTEEKEEEQLNMKTLFFKPIKWYPNELVWELNLDKTKLKKTTELEKLHKSIQQASDSGLITRQELVSMIPPLLLDVKSSDVVFDMCAAPGSKTAQLLEMIYNDHTKTQKLPLGGVIANDADYSRAYMLIHQIQRISTAGMMVLNHNAQNFPTLFEKSEEEAKKLTMKKENVEKECETQEINENCEIKCSFNKNLENTKFDNKFYFDKILADVPCSGDGAIRKLPNKWRLWHTQDGMSLHALQIQILQKGLNLLKVGGLLLYSTCSINPIEDEAVVTELFQRCCDDCFELLDIHSLLPQLIGRKGLVSWEVWEKTSKTKKSKPEEENQENFNHFKNLSDFLPLEEKLAAERSFLKKSMFPAEPEFMKNRVKIENSMRILPHDQNTGGFYLALFRKLKPIALRNAKKEKTTQESENEYKLKKEEEEKIKQVLSKLQAEEENKSNEKKEKPANNKGYPNQERKKQKIEYSQLEQKDWDWIEQFYGISKEFPKEQLIFSGEAGPKKIIFVTAGVKKVLDMDRNGLLNKINLGSKIFAKNKDGFTDNACLFRICQDSINIVFPFMSKRKVCVELEDFKFILLKKNLKHEELANENLVAELKELGSGSIVLIYEKNGISDLLVCQNFSKTLSIMCSKELYGSFQLKYF